MKHYLQVCKLINQPPWTALLFLPPSHLFNPSFGLRENHREMTLGHSRTYR